MAVVIETAAEVSTELVRALASLMPQLNAAHAGPTSAELRDLLADPATTLLTASDDGEIVATATVIVYTTTAWIKARIEDLVVDEAARGRGIGESLVNECLAIARKRGARVVELQAVRRREEARKLSLSMGFERREGNFYTIMLDVDT